MINNFDNISIIHPSMHFLGGAERLVIDLAHALSNMKFNVEIVTGSCHKYWKYELQEKEEIKLKEVGHAISGNIYFWLNPKKYIISLLKMLNSRTNIIITSSYPSSISANLFTKSKKLNILHYLHDAPSVLHDKEGLKVLPLRMKMFYKLISKLYSEEDIKAVQESDVILANSNLTKKINMKIYKLTNEEIKVVYPGINIEYIISQLTNNQNIKAKKKKIPLIFFPRGTHFWWNQELCLQALKRLRVGPFLAFFTGGANYEAAALRKRSRALKLQDKINWIKELSNRDLYSTYSNSTLVVTVPKRQPFGLIPLEALVCGAPSVISRSSGISEVFNDGSDAVIIDENNVDDLTDAIEALIQEPGIRSKIIHNGRYKVITQFTSRKFVNEIIDTLNIL